MTNVISLHRRLDQLSANDGESMAEALVQAQRDDDARQAAWTAAGHPGAPPHKAIPPMSPDASFRAKRLWRLVAEGRARVIYGKYPDASPYASMGSIYTLDDDALLAAINSHPLHAGWPEYDDKPDADQPDRLR